MGFFSLLSLGAVGGILSSGCNLITGADKFTIAGGGTTSSDGGSALATTTVAGTGGSGAANSALTNATGVTIQSIAFYQAVKSTVMLGGNQIVPLADLVAGRPAVVRLFTTVTSPSGGAITARLRIGTHAPIDVPVSAVQTSTDAAISSTINFSVPAEDMDVGDSYNVALLEDKSTSTAPESAAKYPLSGNEALPIKTTGPVKVTLIPIQYGADGSNRLPITTAAQIEIYRARFFQLYPTTEVDITVGPVFPWTEAVGPGGDGWSDLLDALSNKRVSSSAAFDEFYFGVFRPADTIDAYCGGGCTAGLGFIGDPSQVSTRAAIGLDFGGSDSADTAVHEVGHNHGRQHSPCGGAGDPDPSYPYAGGVIGAWGMDLTDMSLKEPSTYHDMMGYCDNVWISDYVYQSILGFQQSLYSSDVYFPPGSRNQIYQRVLVDPTGAKLKGSSKLDYPAIGPTLPVTLTTTHGTTTVEGVFYAFDHLSGGTLYFKSTDPVKTVDATVQTSTGPRTIHAIAP